MLLQKQSMGLVKWETILQEQNILHQIEHNSSVS